jgi:predicted nuclease of predicted toxin-antitoxin system
MRFKLDEHLPKEAAEVLHGAGFAADTVDDEGLGGTSDTTLSQTCAEEERILITMDLGFADIRTYPPGTHPGIVVLRLPRQDKQTIVILMKRAAKALQRQAVSGQLWIVDLEKIRIRG